MDMFFIIYEISCIILFFIHSLLFCCNIEIELEIIEWTE